MLGYQVRRSLPLCLFSCARDNFDLGMDQQVCH
jgi:hypothetical protein